MVLKIYLFIVFLVLFMCHILRKNAEIRQYKELLKHEKISELLETRTFNVIDKYEISNLSKLSPPTYILKLQSVESKETYEEEHEVSLGTYLKTKIGEKKDYDIYNVYGSNEVLLVDREEKKHFFFDEIKVLLICEYTILAILGFTVLYFLIIAFLV